MKYKELEIDAIRRYSLKYLLQTLLLNSVEQQSLIFFKGLFPPNFTKIKDFGPSIDTLGSATRPCLLINHIGTYFINRIVVIEFGLFVTSF